jgi:subtilase family serine protease
LTAAVLGALALACAGPRAKVTDTGVRPSARAGYYRVNARITNAGGRGQIELTIRLRNSRDGRIVTQAQAVDLQPRDHTDVAVEIPAPPGDYTVDVQADYPPR